MTNYLRVLMVEDFILIHDCVYSIYIWYTVVIFTWHILLDIHTEYTAVLHVNRPITRLLLINTTIYTVLFKEKSESAEIHTSFVITREVSSLMEVVTTMVRIKLVMIENNNPQFQSVKLNTNVFNLSRQISARSGTYICSFSFVQSCKA